MIDKGKHNVLGILIDAVDYDAAVAKIIDAAHEQRSLTVSALAVHGVMTGVLDPSHGYRLNHLDLVVPDGQPVRWALNLLYKLQLPDRVYGPTLTLKVCEQAAKACLPIFLYGSKPEILESLKYNLCQRFSGLQIVGAKPSKFRRITPPEKQEVIRQIQASGAAIALIGLGCPRQETWIYEYCGALSMPLLAVGAAFDFHAGSLSQAPPILQKMGLEWAYRLAKEPGRLWRRYLLLNPHYLWLLGQQWLNFRSFPVLNTDPPLEEMSYG